jgi:nucleotide-binding universal stress UspA family protein
MKILIALDNSIHSEQLVDIAIAMPFDTPEFTLLSVVETVEYNPLEVGEVLSKKIENHNQEIAEQTKQSLEKAVLKFRENGKSAKSSQLEGDPRVEIVKYAKSSGTTLIMMGARGMGAIKSALLGSISRGVLINSHCSVMIIKSFKSPLPLKKGSGIESINLYNYYDLPIHGGTFYCMPVYGDFPDYDNQLNQKLDQGVSKLKECLPGVEVNKEVVYGVADIPTDFVKRAQDSSCDVIVAGNKGKSLIDRILIGTVSKSIVENVEKIFLIIK